MQVINLYMNKQSNILDVSEEIRDGAHLINERDMIITAFGSARSDPSGRCYEYARNVCFRLGEAGFSIMTGGGPGIMEAASKGGFEAGVSTYGIDIELPHEQAMNPYINRPFVCNYLPSRKYLLMSYSVGFVVFPGGYGTLDELFEVLTLISTGKIKTVPVVLAGSEFWRGLKSWAEGSLLGNDFINLKEYDFLNILDDPDQIVEVLKKNRADNVKRC